MGSRSNIDLYVPRAPLDLIHQRGLTPVTASARSRASAGKCPESLCNPAKEMQGDHNRAATGTISVTGEGIQLRSWLPEHLVTLVY